MEHTIATVTALSIMLVALMLAVLASEGLPWILRWLELWVLRISRRVCRWLHSAAIKIELRQMKRNDIVLAKLETATRKYNGG